MKIIETKTAKRKYRCGCEHCRGHTDIQTFRNLNPKVGVGIAVSISVIGVLLLSGLFISDCIINDRNPWEEAKYMFWTCIEILDEYESSDPDLNGHDYYNCTSTGATACHS